MAEFQERRSQVSAVLAGLKVEALLISSPASVRYLTGYTGSNGLVLMTASGAHFFTDPRYALVASKTITCKVHIAKRPLIEEASRLIARKRYLTVGLEPAWMNVGDFRRLQDLVGPRVTLEAVSGTVERLRMIKSPSEIARIRRSVNLNSQAFERTIARVKPGMRESDIAAELEFQMRRLGAEKPAFETIVAAGVNSALPHAHPTSYRLQGKELLLVDMGACLEGYASDMTRVVYLGTPPRPTRQMYRAVLEAQLAALDVVRAGVPAAKVDAAARNVLKQHKLDRAFVHSTGHGLGLEIHEGPRVARKDKTELEAGMTITIEPGVYLDGVGGIRIEDTILVTESGCEVLTPTTKEFVTL